MNPTAASQIAFDNALASPKARLTIGKCNNRISFSKPQREATYQVTLDALKFSPCYPTFLITAEVPEIYMHQLWNLICPKLPDQPFNIPLFTDEEIVPFIYELGYTGNIKTFSELVIDHMHQPLRTFVFVINRCISGKAIGLDKPSGAKDPKKERKFKMHASLKLKTVPVSPKEPIKKPAKKTVPTRKSSKSQAVFIIKDTPGISTQGGYKEKQERLSYLLDTQFRVPDVPKYQFKSNDESWGDSEDDDNDDDSDDVSKGDDDKAKTDDGNDAHDSEKTNLNDDVNPSFTLKEYKEEEHDEEYA
nr:hypothetical protein [Tanacetum cinerariifolium]